MSATIGRGMGWEPAAHTVGIARCTCGWLVSRDTEQEARRAGEVHSLRHRTRGELAILPIQGPPRRIGAYSAVESREVA